MYVEIFEIFVENNKTLVSKVCIDRSNEIPKNHHLLINEIVKLSKHFNK